MRRQLGPRTLALVDHGDGPALTWVRLYRDDGHSHRDAEKAAFAEADPDGGPTGTEELRRGVVNA
ncbi:MULTISPECIES: hypothetical protein [unclassified Pseudofrankia]|uniref:hypothetical protein n=1 Tax=unclassified Pseudofrankia TaxID=2994372 RepID=UPI0008DABAAD|nr:MULTISPECIES: hypothetical protein [unclassified Pseudofrankia]MDT3440849.1 hypothetical protein [Pseudofrankia sp. BMG5.37]OHV43693.1 hypothetical protein BCD48_27350 [Pseudofrankia sp. BMG5.36]